MFSALKKLVGSEPGQLREKPIPAGLQSMNQSLQRRFAKGVQYNSKCYIWCSQLNTTRCFHYYVSLVWFINIYIYYIILYFFLINTIFVPQVKIVIRGDRNTGKSTLWHRLQGKKFVEEYLPTQEIQATSIHWNYKSKSFMWNMSIGQLFPVPASYFLFDNCCLCPCNLQWLCIKVKKKKRIKKNERKIYFRIHGIQE